MIAVTGATGNVGRALVEVLAGSGEPVTSISRSASTSADGVIHRPADLADPQTLREAFAGVDALFLISAGERPRDIVEVASERGVRRIVLLSSQGAGTRPQSYAVFKAFEDAVTDSDLEWTILRPGGFDSNAFAWIESVRTGRTVAAPFGDIGLPTIDPSDIAEVAATVLRETGHAGRVYELTGPALTSPRDRARAIGDALGEPVRFVEQTRDEARAQMSQFMPEPVVEGTLAILGEPLSAEQRVSPSVREILGRSSNTFADWAARNIVAFK